MSFIVGWQRALPARVLLIILIWYTNAEIVESQQRGATEKYEGKAWATMQSKQ